MRKVLFVLVFASMLGVVPMWGHELILKPSSFEAEKGAELAVELQSTHVFIVKEEVEDVSKITAGIVRDGVVVPSELRGNEPELRIDFSVKVPEGNSSALIAANKTGDVWCVTPDGWKPGTRKAVEAEGFKVTRASMTDKFTKAIINPSASDNNFAAVVGQELEVVPVTNPADAKTGQFFKVRILHDGQPSSTPVYATYDGFVTEFENTYAYYTESDQEGIANIKITSPGIWIIRAAVDNLPGAEGEYDARNLRSILTVEVK
ncbi:MAG: DUF4198 domain-containing protein [Synergistaceae bacterium]|nr:DUF4198 domain-containing protein [Synergistaceae bacterium]